nr:hypothetical protein [uncultured Allomuricauda sp.]
MKEKIKLAGYDLEPNPILSLRFQKLDSIVVTLEIIDRREKDDKMRMKYETVLWDCSNILKELLSSFHDFSDEIILTPEPSYLVRLIPQLVHRAKLALEFFPPTVVDENLRTHRERLWNINNMLIDSIRT